jgi:hypothetical protein
VRRMRKFEERSFARTLINCVRDVGLPTFVESVNDNDDGADGRNLTDQSHQIPSTDPAVSK